MPSRAARASEAVLIQSTSSRHWRSRISRIDGRLVRRGGRGLALSNRTEDRRLKSRRWQRRRSGCLGRGAGRGRCRCCRFWHCGYGRRFGRRGDRRLKTPRPWQWVDRNPTCRCGHDGWRQRARSCTGRRRHRSAARRQGRLGWHGRVGVLARGCRMRRNDGDGWPGGTGRDQCAGWARSPGCRRRRARGRRRRGCCCRLSRSSSGRERVGLQRPHVDAGRLQNGAPGGLRRREPHQQHEAGQNQSTRQTHPRHSSRFGYAAQYITAGDQDQCLPPVPRLPAITFPGAVRRATRGIASRAAMR